MMEFLDQPVPVWSTAIATAIIGVSAILIFMKGGDDDGD